MKKRSGFLLLFMAAAIQWSLCVLTCASDSNASPARNNVYGSMGGAIPTADADYEGGFTVGAGYEGAIGDSFSLGVYAGGVVGETTGGFEFLLKPRFYPFKSSLEKLFIGGNVGINMYEKEVSNGYSYDGYSYGYSYEPAFDFIAGLNLGYKFVLGRFPVFGSNVGFSLEPSIGYDFLPGRITAGVAFGYVWGGTAPTPAPRPVAAAPRTADTGLYLGIIGFNETLSRREIAILNSGNRSQFQQFITSLRIGPATGLYHAVDSAISMLEAAGLPDDLVSVSIVTFTDGLDNISIELNPNYSTRDSFRDGLQNRIANTTIKGLSIDAYSVGVQGGDVRDEAAFRAGLMALATANGANPLGRNVYFSRDMTEVNAAFRTIAGELNKRNLLQSIKLRITGGYDDGTRIRFTFDNVTDRTIGNSNSYIEGTYRRVGSSRSLENVVFHGLSSSSGTTITGEVTGTYVNFTFENVKTDTDTLVEMRNAQQWEYLPSMSLWQRNSEFNPLSDSQTIVDRKSAVILLVLDCTTSLTAGGANGFEEMKAAANTFLNTLTN